ncbi:MAG: PEP/pyruvate-binding domain-containing protein, partial [Saprospiraceae bacterium]
KNTEGKEIARASTIKEFEGLIRKVDDSTIMYHAVRDDFSHWLMARSEIQLAKVLLPKKHDEFQTAKDIREFLLRTIQQYKDEKTHGNIVSIDKIHWDIEGNIISLSNGSFGGKGRGLSFANSLFYQYSLENKYKDMKLKIPKTAVIGIKEFEEFVSKIDFDLNNVPCYDDIKNQFLNTDFNISLDVKLAKLLSYFDKPLAVRSSGSFEDSISQPFSGIFETYIIPNNNKDNAVRLKQLQQAIKLVYASVFSNKSKNYAKALDLRIGEEKMAVVIQELVGFEKDGLFFPHLSGVAQSYNFYPFANMKAEDGYAVTAFGLGLYVVNGENAFRFSPKNPHINALSLEDQVKYTQHYFYALDMTKNDFNLLEGSMATIKKVEISDFGSDSILTHCVSKYDFNNRMLYPGISKNGQIVVNFASILKNEYLPLSKALTFLLKIFEKSFGSPIEIEFAVDITEPSTFYLLQVKPLFKAINNYTIDIDSIDKNKCILFSEKMMGNGVLDDLNHIVFVKPGAFDKTNTEKMAMELEAINDEMIKKEFKYILIGPGRWGTKDRFLGVPVSWPQISNAKVIIETDLEGFPLDASYGSHFFHNLTTLNVAYFSVVKEDDSYINFGFDYAGQND